MCPTCGLRKVTGHELRVHMRTHPDVLIDTSVFIDKSDEESDDEKSVDAELKPESNNQAQIKIEVKTQAKPNQDRNSADDTISNDANSDESDDSDDSDNVNMFLINISIG